MPSLEQTNFGLGILQESLIISRFLYEEGKNEEDLKDYLTAGNLNHTKNVLIAYREYEKTLPKCPMCGKIMYYYPVNNTPSRMIGGGWNIVWECPDEECGFDMNSADPQEKWEFKPPGDTHPLAKSLSKFNPEKLRKVAAVLDYLKKTDSEIKDVEEHIRRKKEETISLDEARYKFGRILKLISPKCPKCGNALIPFKVDENERGWKSIWVCSKDWFSKDMEKWCDYEKLETKTIREVLDEGIQYQIRSGPEEGIKVERAESSK